MSDDKIKDALHMLPYGFYAIGSRNGDDVNIMVLTWLMQAAFEPRQIAMALQKSAYTHEVIRAGRVFSVNIFQKADADIVKGFTKSRAKDADKVNKAHFTDGPVTGCPILEGAAGYLECRVVNIIDSGGDHDLIIADVVGAGVNKEGDAASTLTLPDIGWSYAG